jgi:hypothetical protein
MPASAVIKGPAKGLFVFEMLGYINDYYLKT